MSFRAIALLLTAVALLGYAAVQQTPPADYEVRITTFRVTGADLPLSLLDQPANADAALYTRLADMVRDGTAEITAHQHATISPGKEVQLGAIKEFPYPTEYFPVPGTDLLMPKVFEYKNCGTSTSIGNGTVGDHNRAEESLGSIGIERIRGGDLSRWPVHLPATGREGFLNYPKFLTEKTSFPIRIADSQLHLLSIVREAGETTPGPERYLLSFAKIAPRHQQAPAPFAPASLMRFHALTFRLDAKTGCALLNSQPPGSDASLLAVLLSATRDGTATISHQAAVLVGIDNLEQEDPVMADPFARSPNPLTGRFTVHRTSFQAEAIEEFPYPTEYSEDFLPQSFEYKNLGRSFEVKVKRKADAGGILAEINLGHYHAPEMVTMPEVFTPQVPQVYMPAIPSTSLVTTLKIRPGGVYCLGAVTLADYLHRESPAAPVMEISLLKIAGADSDASPASSLTAYESELISLPTEHAATLNALRHSPAEALAFLDEAMENGTSHSLTMCRIAGADAFPANITVQFEDPICRKAIWTKGGKLHPGAFEFYTLGTSFEAKPAASGMPATLNFSHNITSLALPSLETLIQVANADGSVPEPARHPSKFVLPLPAAHPIIGQAEPCRVPAGHPEADRWQVLVTRRR